MGNCCQRKSTERGTIALQDVQETSVQQITERHAIALYSLDSHQSTILNFVAGDILVIEDDRDEDWYLARHVSGNRKGFAPKTYVSLDINVGSEDWFFEHTNRADAERLLHQPENPPGSFMIRKSHIPGIYALSIKDHEVQSDGSFIVHHYKIRALDRGGYFIVPSIAFSTLKQLVCYYANSDGLCCMLGKACLKPRPTMPGPSPDVRDEYEITPKDLVFVKQLGKGNFGEVFYGYWKTLEVAIKCATTTGLQSDDFKKEMAVMKAISHPKIVRLYAVCTTKEPYCIVMEYMNKGNLQQHLRSAHGKQLKLPSLVNIAEQIADGMQYLEAKSLIHRDLAARNVLVNDGDIVKLADFGLARIMDEAVYVSSGGKLPVKWTAPEAYTSGEFNIKSDVWSFGIVLYEIFTHGDTPYPGMSNQEVSKAIRQHDYRMPKPPDRECSDAVYEIMLQCWRKKPSKRPTFEYLCHFFMDYYVASEQAYREGASFD